MSAAELLKRVSNFGVIRVVGETIEVESDQPLPERILNELKERKNELIALLRDRPAVDYEYCKSKDCKYFLDHKANPRCLHPLCTKNGKHPAGLWLRMLVECPADTNRLRWYVPKVSHDHGGTLPEHIHAGGGQAEKDEDSGIFYGINAVFL